MTIQPQAPKSIVEYVAHMGWLDDDVPYYDVVMPSWQGPDVVTRVRPSDLTRVLSAAAQENEELRLQNTHLKSEVCGLLDAKRRAKKAAIARTRKIRGMR